jgi:hypothetical protein
MRDLFDPRSFGPSRRVVIRHLPARAPRRFECFDVRAFGPRTGDRQLSRWSREWHRHARWLATLAWPERVVIIIGEMGWLISPWCSECWSALEFTDSPPAWLHAASY